MFSFVVLPFPAPRPPQPLPTEPPERGFMSHAAVYAIVELVFLLVVPIYCCPKQSHTLKKLKIAW